MHLDPLLLSRVQWAWVIGWHILLPAFTVGLAITQTFLLIGTLLLLPVILMSTAWSNWVFRGKMWTEVGYDQS